MTRQTLGLWLLFCTGLLFAGKPALADTCEPPASLATAAQGQAHMVDVDGHSLALWSKSPARPQKTKATILLVHGRTWSGRPDFDLTTPCEDLSLMNGLVAAGIATYAVDMRGYGRTDRDASGWLTPNRAAKDIAGVLRWLNTRLPEGEKTHLFGWSYGATMAQLSVQRNPELARSLTLFGYAVRKGYHRTPADLPDTAPANANTHKNAVSDFIVPNSISAEAIEAFAQMALAADPLRADWRELEQWRALDGKQVPLPTLLLQAEFDPLTRRRAHRKLFRRLPHPNKKWVVIKGGDHAAFMETPRDRFLAELSQFVLANNSPD